MILCFREIGLLGTVREGRGGLRRPDPLSRPTYCLSLLSNFEGSGLALER